MNLSWVSRVNVHIEGSSFLKIHMNLEGLRQVVSVPGIITTVKPHSDPSLVYRLQVGKFSYLMPLALARCFSGAGWSQVRFCGEIISFTPQNETANPGVSDSGGEIDLGPKKCGSKKTLPTCRCRRCDKLQKNKMEAHVI